MSQKVATTMIHEGSREALLGTRIAHPFGGSMMVDVDADVDVNVDVDVDVDADVDVHVHVDVDVDIDSDSDLQGRPVWNEQRCFCRCQLIC